MKDRPILELLKIQIDNAHLSLPKLINDGKITKKEASKIIRYFYKNYIHKESFSCNKHEEPRIEWLKAQIVKLENEHQIT
jgi:polyhydroxyalkanoate synthesis regulator phasin